jgi:hypothetical protein
MANTAVDSSSARVACIAHWVKESDLEGRGADGGIGRRASGLKSALRQGAFTLCGTSGLIR